MRAVSDNSRIKPVRANKKVEIFQVSTKITKRHDGFTITPLHSRINPTLKMKMFFIDD